MFLSRVSFLQPTVRTLLHFGSLHAPVRPPARSSAHSLALKQASLFSLILSWETPADSRPNEIRIRSVRSKPFMSEYVVHIKQGNSSASTPAFGHGEKYLHERVEYRVNFLHDSIEPMSGAPEFFLFTTYPTQRLRSTAAQEQQ